MMVDLPKPGKSALGRMVLTITALSLLLSVGLASGIIVTTKHSLDRQVEETLAADVLGFMDLYEQRRVIGIREGMERRQTLFSDQSQIFLLQDKDGRKLGGNIDNWSGDTELFDQLQDFHSAAEGDKSLPYRGTVLALRGGFKLMMARSLADNERVIAEQIRTSIIATTLITTLCAILGLFFVRRVLRQIGAINNVARRVEQGFLNERVNVPEKRDEYFALTSNFNRMLDELSTHHARMNRLSEHIAHELKTPLNRMKRVLHGLSTSKSENVDAFVEKMEKEVDETIDTFDAVLEIVTANTTVADKTRFEPVDIVTLIDDLVTLYEPVAHELGLTFGWKPPAKVFILGERAPLQQMVSNVLDNALKFALPNSRIAIKVQSVEEAVVFNFMNNSASFSDAEREGLFSQFERGSNAADTPGYGLGLPLVKAIASRHDMTVSIPGDTSGFKIEFRCARHET